MATLYADIAAAQVAAEASSLVKYTGVNTDYGYLVVNGVNKAILDYPPLGAGYGVNNPFRPSLMALSFGEGSTLATVETPYNPASTNAASHTVVAEAVITRRFATVATLLADTGTHAEGDTLEVPSMGFAYTVSASGATDHHLTTAGSVKLYVNAGENGHNLRAFNAKGDGVTDDTAAMDACIAAADGGTTYVPSGDYLLSAPIKLGNTVSLVGEGAESVKFILTHAGVGIQVHEPLPGPTAAEAVHRTYSGFTIIANATTTYAFWVMRVQFCLFSDIYITVPQATGSGYTGFRISGSTYLCTFTNCISDTAERTATKHGGKAWWIGNGENEVGHLLAATNENTFVTCRGIRADVGFDIDSARGCTIINSGGESCTSAGLHLRGNDNQIFGLWGEGTTIEVDQYIKGDGAGGFFAADSPEGNTITSNYRNTYNINYSKGITLLGARINSITIGANASYTSLVKCTVLTSITNNGTYSDLDYSTSSNYYRVSQRNTKEAFRVNMLNNETLLYLNTDKHLRAHGDSALELSSDRGMKLIGADPQLILSKQTAPGASNADTARLCLIDNGSGKMQLIVRFPSGVAQILATEP